MNEIKIDLTEVNSQEFFGEQNAHIEKFRSYFPKLKVVARGNTLKGFGEEEVLEEFKKRINMLITHFAKYNSLTD